MLNSDIIFNNSNIANQNFAQIQQFGVEDPSLSEPANVDIFINDVSIKSIVGPTPLIDISRTYNNTDGYISDITENINLNGKIIPQAINTGFVPIMSGISGLQDLFNCPSINIRITCGGEVTYKASGVIVKQLSANKTEDNWTRTADFTIDLENRIDISGEKQTVQDQAESWTIEPLEEVSYVNFSQNVNGNAEYLNPRLRPTAPSRGNGIPSSNLNGTNNPESSLGINTFGQYRITRRLSAKGLPWGSGSLSGCLNDREIFNKVRLHNAKQWVEDTAKKISVNGSGSFHFSSLMTNSISGAVFYNHTRSLSADLYNGTFEMTDNWIAMPTGTNHTESFTIDSSSSDSFTKTVRVAGTINGLAAYNHQSHENNSIITSLDPKTTKNINLYPAGTQVNKSGTIPDNPPGAGNTVLNPNKYQNAKDAWEKSIKPYIYRRACLGMSQEGKSPRAATNEVDPNKPESPAFFQDRMLGTIPVSTSETYDPYRGVITYNYEFNNKYKAISGAISENISVNHDAPSDNISETIVLGRYLGPIIQSIGRTNARKTITIDIVVQPPQTLLGSIPDSQLSPIGLNTDLRNQIENFINGHAPFYARDASVFGQGRTAKQGTVYVQQDTESWSPTDGRFSKTISWIYQQCDVNKHWLDY